MLFSLVYLKTTPRPWNIQLFGEVLSIETDPLIYVNNDKAISYIGLPRRFHTLENPTKFHATLNQQSYHDVFYRPDFEQFPVTTLFILLFRLATYVGIVLFLYLLAGVLKSVYEGHPFRQKNYRNLLYMGIIMVFLSLVRTFHSTVLANYLSHSPRLDGWEMTTSYIYLWLLPFGLLIVIMSYVFKELLRIHEEQKLTI